MDSLYPSISRYIVLFDAHNLKIGKEVIIRLIYEIEASRY